MRYLSKACFVIALGSAGGSMAGPLGEELEAEQRQAIATIPVEFVERALGDDWVAVSELYHEEAIVMLPDQPAVEGRDEIREALAQMLGSEGGVRLTELSVHLLEAEGMDDLLYVRARYEAAVAMIEDEEVTAELQGPYINILRQDEDGSWHIWRQIVNREHPPVVLDPR